MKEKRWSEVLPWAVATVFVFTSVALLWSSRISPVVPTRIESYEGDTPRNWQADRFAPQSADVSQTKRYDQGYEIGLRVVPNPPSEFHSAQAAPRASPLPLLQPPAKPNLRPSVSRDSKDDKNSPRDLKKSPPSREGEKQGPPLVQAPAAPGSSAPGRPLGRNTQDLRSGILAASSTPPSVSRASIDAETRGWESRTEGPRASGSAVWAVDTQEARASTAVSSPREVFFATASRSQALELAARESDLHTQTAFELASRGAYYAARAQFLAAVRIVAQALDAEHRTTLHSHALTAGLTAMQEARDFAPRPSVVEADLDVASIASGHRTPVLHGPAGQGVTPQRALESYFTFAQAKLGMAGGRELAASMAYYGLGKLHALLADQPGEPSRLARPQAMAFLQAALLVHPQNHLASHELGTLLARANRFEDARKALTHSVSIQTSPIALRNLAWVYRQLGQEHLAAQTWQIAAAAEQNASPRGFRVSPHTPVVLWVDPDQFAASPRSASLASSRASPQDGVRLAGYHSPSAGFVTPTLGPRGYHVANPTQVSSAPGGSAAISGFVNPRFGQEADTFTSPPEAFAVQDATSGWRPRDRGEAERAIFWQLYLQGEYVARPRSAHVNEYRLRPDDQLDMIYRVTREETSQPYRLNVGDEVRVESLTDPNLNRDLQIQPDGTITLRLLGQVKATGKTVSQLCEDLEQAYRKYYKVPAISVTPLKMNTRLEDLRATVDRRQGVGGQSQLVRVTPEGTISLPALGCVAAQGLTLGELQQELNERYRDQIEGMEVIPVLVQRAPRFVYVLGEVRMPGRFEMAGPTTLIQAISMAGGWTVGSNLRQVVVFRRDDSWRLVATMVNLQPALYARQPCPAGEIWLSDSDVVIVPKGKILVADEFIELVFTRGIYGVFPLSSTIAFTKLSTL